MMTAVLVAVLIGAAVFQRTALADEYDITYKLTTLDGETITETTYGDRVQLLVFYDAAYDEDGYAAEWRSRDFMQSLQEELEHNWVKQNDVIVILVPYTAVSDEQVHSFLEKYGSEIKSDNVVFTKADTSLMYTICSNDTIRPVCCIPVQKGRRLDYLDNLYDLKDTRDMMAKYVDMTVIYQIVQVEVKYDYTAAFRILELVNEARAEEGLSPLTMDEELLECAMQRAAELSIMDSHIRPSGERCFTISSLAYGENIAVGYNTASMVMDGWMDSEGHRGNILDPDWTSIGVGGVIVDNGYEKQYFWCQLFGKRVESAASSSDYFNCIGHPKITVLDYYLEKGGYIGQAINYDVGNIALGESVQAQLWYLYALGSCTTVGTPIWPGCMTYTSSDPSVASVDENGLVTANKAGTATITMRAKYSSPKATYLYRFEVEVPLPQPVITTQPSNVSVAAGNRVTFKVTATGEGLSYQWYCRSSASGKWNALNTNSAKTATLSITTNANQDGYQFYCAVTNEAGTVDSNAATLTVTAEKPGIIKQPSNANVAAGSRVTFRVTASGEGVRYQWYCRSSASGKWNALNTSSAKSAALTLTTSAKQNGYQFFCAVTNDAGTTNTRAATLTIAADKPAITTQPSNVRVAAGNRVAFKVTATGEGLSYQWYCRSSASGKWNALNTNSAKTATLSITTTAKQNGYQFYCAVTNAAGTTNSNAATLTITAGKPTITTQPANANVAAGSRVTFRVAASGTGLSYQWYCRSSASGKWNALNTSSAKTAALTLTTTAKQNGYQFYCAVTNEVGTTDSNAVTLTVQ